MINIYNVDFFEPLESHITFVIKIKKIISNNICIVKLVSAYYMKKGKLSRFPLYMYAF